MRLMHINWSRGFSGSDSEAGRWTFLVDAAVPVGEEEARVRVCINNWYGSVPIGGEQRIRGFNPNWGDAMTEINAEWWHSYGLFPQDEPIPEVKITVDHDEALFSYW